MSASSSSLLIRLLRIFRKLLAEESPPSGKGWFSKPVDIVALNIPDYPSIVAHPMDLGTVEAKYESGAYESIRSMAADVLLTFDNALLYNGQDSVVGAEALRLKLYFIKHYEKLAAEIGETVPGVSTAAAAQPPSTAAAVAANAASKKAGAGSAAAAASSSSSAAASAAASGSKDWVVPDLAITDAIRLRIVGILTDLQADPVSELFRTRVPDSETKYHLVIQSPMDLTTIKAALFKKSLRSVAEVDAHVELIHSNAVLYNAGEDKGAKSIRKDATQLRQKWRTKIKALADKIAKDGATAGSSAAAASSSGATAHAADADKTDSEDESTATTKGPRKSGGGGGKAGKKTSAQREALSSLLSSLLSALSAKALGFFQYPVDKRLYPEYYEDIARPISLDEIHTRLGEGKYDAAPARFLDDVALVWENACSYNQDGSEVHTVATQARKKWDKILEQHASKEIKELERARNNSSAAKAEKAEKADKADKTDKASTKKKSKTAAAAAAAPSPAAASSSSSAAAAAPAAQLPPTPPPAPVDISGGALSLSKCRQVLAKLKLNHPDLLVWFVPPVSELDFPKYSSKVKRPMCVEWMHDKLGKGTYASNQSFAEDGEQIWKNCLIFNGPEAPITKSAMVLRAEFRRLFAAEFGVSTLTAHMEMVEEAHRVAEERWKLECQMAAVMGTPKPRPPVPPPKPITVPKASAAAAAPVPVAAAAASAPKPAAAAAVSTPPKAAAPAAVVKTEAPSPKLPTTVAPTAPAVAAASPAVAAAAPAAASAASTSSTPSPAPVSTGTLSIAPDPAFYTPERLAELSAELDPSIALNSLVQKLLREDIHDYFRRPVTITADIADYVTKIPRPMDLGTLKKQLLANHYPTYRALCDDIELIWGNAIGYNGPTHAVSNAAAFMRRKAHNYTLEMLAAHAHAEANKNKMPEALRKHATGLFSALLKTASYAASFTAPIEDTPNFEHYKSKVPHPISLGDVRRKLDDNSYRSLDEFLDEVRLCLRNAIDFYSLPETDDAQRIWSLQAQVLLNEFEMKVLELEHKLTMTPGAGAKGYKGSKLKGVVVIPPAAALRKSTTGGSAAASTPDAQGDTPMGSADGSAASAGAASFPLQSLSPEDLKKCTVVLDALSAETSGFTSFNLAVDPSVYHLMDYFRVVSTPMDLSLIGRKLKIGRYASTDDFCADVDRITQNVVRYYGDAHPEFPDGRSLIELALALRAQFKHLWDNYAKGVNLKKIAAAAAIGLTASVAASPPPPPPQSNLTPPVFAKNNSVAPLSPMRGAVGAGAGDASAAAAAAAAAGGLKEKEPLVYDPASIPAGMSVAEYEHALRKEMKRKRKEKKEEKRKRKREEGGGAGGEVDVMKLSPPGSPDHSAEPPSAAAAAMSPLPHAKMQRVAPLSGAAAGAEMSSPRRIAGPASSAAPTAGAPPPAKLLKMKLGGETSAAQLYQQPLPEVPRVHISLTQRRKLLELAAAKLNAPAPVPAVVPVAAASASPASAAFILPEAPAVGSFRNANEDRSGDGMFDVPAADSAALPASIPGAPSAMASGVVAAVAAAAASSPASSVRALPLPMPPMQRAYSHLTPLLALQPQRGAKKSKTAKDKIKKAKKQKAMMAQLASYQEQVAAQRAKRNAGQLLLGLGGPKPSLSQQLTVLPSRIRASDVPAYLTQGFSRLSADSRVLVRVVHSALPPSALFPFAIDQHLIVAAQVAEDDDEDAALASVEIQLQLSDAVSMQLSAAAQADIFDRWITIKAAIDETRGLKSVQRTDLALLEHPLTSSHLSSHLSFFASLSPALQWHSGAACYTHSIEFTASQPALPLDQQDAAAAPIATPPLSFERALELSLLLSDSDSDSDEDDDGDRAHARPFFGALKTPCRMAGCVVTAAAGGGYYHRCPARLSKLAASSSASSSSSAAQASVSCRGVLVWSLPSSLFLRVDGREFGPTPFGSQLGLWKERATIEEEQLQRMQRLRAAQLQHEAQASQAPLELSSLLNTLKPSSVHKQEAAVSMSD